MPRWWLAPGPAALCRAKGLDCWPQCWLGQQEWKGWPMGPLYSLQGFIHPALGPGQASGFVPGWAKAGSRREGPTMWVDSLGNPMACAQHPRAPSSFLGPVRKAWLARVPGSSMGSVGRLRGCKCGQAWAHFCLSFVEDKAVADKHAGPDRDPGSTPCPWGALRAGLLRAGWGPPSQACCLSPSGHTGGQWAKM